MTHEHIHTCRELTEFILDYLQGELPTEQRHEFESHLSMCPSCVAYLDSYRKTIALSKCAMTSHATPGPVPADLVKAIKAARDRARNS